MMISPKQSGKIRSLELKKVLIVVESKFKPFSLDPSMCHGGILRFDHKLLNYVATLSGDSVMHCSVMWSNYVKECKVMTILDVAHTHNINSEKLKFIFFVQKYWRFRWGLMRFFLLV